MSTRVILFDLDGTLLDANFTQAAMLNIKPSQMVRGRLYDGVMETLEQLKSHYRFGVVTNKSALGAERDLRHFGLWEKQSALVGSDTLDVCKPDPAPLLHACELLDVLPRDAIFVGDSHADYEAAKGAGMRFVFCSYGYSKTLPAHAMPFAEIEQFSELLSVLSLLAMLEQSNTPNVSP